MKRALSWFSLGTLAAVGACGGATARAPARLPAVATSCERQHPGTGAVGLGGQAGSAVALARDGKRTLAYVADADTRSLYTVDVDTQRELAVTRLGGAPSQAIVLADGRVAVALKDTSKLQVLEPGSDPSSPLEARCTTDVAAEPVALATTPDGQRLLVVSAWGASLAALDVRSLREEARASLPREPRAVVVSDDGRKAFVSHAVGGRMSVVSLANVTKVREIELTGFDRNGRGRGGIASVLFQGEAARGRVACQGWTLAKSSDQSGRILAPQVLVDPGNASVRSSGYGDGAGAAEVQSVAVIDEDADAPLEGSLEPRGEGVGRFGSDAGRGECLLPRAAAVDPATGRLLVACLGIDSVIAMDAASVSPADAEVRRWAVAAGPTGIAIDGERRRAVVWSQFDRTLGVIDLDADDDAKSPVTHLALSRPAAEATDADLGLGRKLFHAAGDARIALDGRACASCHPDGRDDGLTWATPRGPRQTPMLAARLSETAPYGWEGSGEDVHEHLQETFRRLNGQGLADRELDALVAYVRSLPAPPARAIRADTERAARGREIFQSAEAGCSGCHSGSVLADGAPHDVGTRVEADAQARFDTPSLRFVGGTGPWFHDGRYDSLETLLRASDGKMGHTGQLAKADLDALVVYLGTL